MLNIFSRKRSRTRSRKGGSTPQPYSQDIWTAPGAFPSAVGGTKKRRRRR
jgi:hypothetical protein